MVSSDTVVGIVGAVILTGAMIAVFYYENSNADDTPAADLGDGANQYTYTWSDGNTTATESGTITGAGQSTELELPLDGIGGSWVYSVNVSLTWTEDQAQTAGPLNQPDTFRLELIDGNGTAVATADAGASPREISFQVVVPRPGTVTVNADTPEAADELMAANYTAEGGQMMSDWRVRVTLVSTGDSSPTSTLDNANSFSAEILVRYHMPTRA